MGFPSDAGAQGVTPALTHSTVLRLGAGVLYGQEAWKKYERQKRADAGVTCHVSLLLAVLLLHYLAAFRPP